MAVAGPDRDTVFTDSGAVARREVCAALARRHAASLRRRAFRDDLSEREMLQGCHRSLQTEGAVTHAEADWIVREVAALMGWLPGFPAERY